MPIVPITKEQFGKKRFKRNLTYHFASQDMIAPLALQELPTAMMHVPVAFARVQNQLMPVTIQGLGKDKNLFVAPDGRWIGRYLPMCYRFQPFTLAALDDGKQVLCCEDSSDLLSDTDGEPFFEGGEHPSQTVTSLLNVLGEHARNRQATTQMCAFLQEQGLISQWPIKLKDEASDREITVEGLFRIDEVVFNQLEPNKLAKVRDVGAMPLIYCQLLSMQHLPILGQLSKAHLEVQRRSGVADIDTDQSDLTFSADDTTISFENL
jgi:hypothetical protein